MSNTSKLLRDGHGIVREETIRRQLSDQELDEKRQEFVTMSGQLADKQDHIKEVIRDLKDEIKPIKQQVAMLLDVTRKGYIEEHRRVRLEANDQNYTIEQYDPESGELLAVRPQNADERPPLLFRTSPSFTE